MLSRDSNKLLFNAIRKMGRHYITSKVPHCMNDINYNLSRALMRELNFEKIKYRSVSFSLRVLALSIRFEIPLITHKKIFGENRKIGLSNRLTVKGRYF